MTSVRTLIVALSAAAFLLTSAGGAFAQPPPKVTWGDAPAIAKKMVLTVEDMRSVFREGMRSYVSYEEPGRTGCVGESSAPLPRIYGTWRVTKEGKPDTQYRVDDETFNPFPTRVCTGFRFTPPRKAPYAYDEIANATIIVRSEVNQAFGMAANVRRQILEGKKRQNEGTHQRLVADAEKRWRHDYIPDLGWGLDYQGLSVRSSSHQVDGQIELIRLRDGLSVTVEFKSHQDKGLTGELSAQRLAAIAKGAAALLARRVFGANASAGGEEEEGQVGIIDAYIATQLAEVPQMDTRSDVVPYGQRFTVAVVFKPSRRDLSPDKVIIRVDMRPSKEQVEASQKLPNPNDRLLYEYRYHEVWRNEGAWGVAATRQTKLWGPGTYVTYTTYPTLHNFVSFGKVRQGQWDIRVRMYEPPVSEPGAGAAAKPGQSRPVWDTHTEVSDTKLLVTIVRPKPAAPPVASGGAPTGRAGQSVGEWKD